MLKNLLILLFTDLILMGGSVIVPSAEGKTLFINGFLIVTGLSITCFILHFKENERSKKLEKIF